MKVFGLHIDKRQILLLLVDFLLLLLALQVAFVLRLGRPFNFETFYEMVDRYTGATTSILLVHFVCFYVFELYNTQLNFRSFRHLARILVAVIAAGLVLAVMYFLLPNWKFGRGILSYHTVFIFFSVALWRVAYSFIPKELETAERGAILGAGPGAQQLMEERGAHWPEENVEIVTLLDRRKELHGTTMAGLAVEDASNLKQVAQSMNLTYILLADEAGWDTQLLGDALDCKILGVRIRDLAEVYKRLTGKVPVRHVAERYFLLGPGFSSQHNTFERNFWRVFDIAVAGVGLLLAAPLMALLSLIVLIFNGRPVLFVQERLGRDEVPFRLMKFRTMVNNAERETGAVWATHDDPRVTRLGRILRRSRLDELPQLVNVLTGEMSIVGPRPEREEFVTQLKKEIPFYSLRFSVRPGLTGWAQVNYRYGASVQDSMEKLQYELYYIQERSLLLNVAILLKTVQVMLLKPGS